MAGPGGEQRMVTLLSPDKQTFQVPWDVAMRSTVVKQMLEGDVPALHWILFVCQGGRGGRLRGVAWAGFHVAGFRPRGFVAGEAACIQGGQAGAHLSMLRCCGS